MTHFVLSSEQPILANYLSEMRPVMELGVRRKTTTCAVKRRLLDQPKVMMSGVL